MNEPIVIVGAGVAGITAARALVDDGHVVRLVDKGRSVGGRLATRRIGDASLDHGAQFFTVRGERFATTVADAARHGIVTEWCRGFDGGDGHARYAARGGMNRLAKQWADGLDVVLDTRIEAVRLIAGGWLLDHAGGALNAGALVLTAPVPQSLELLDAGRVGIDPDLRHRLQGIAYHRTLALLVVLDRPSAIPSPGGVQPERGPFAFVADNAEKGVSTQPAVTLHASHELSSARWDDDPDLVRADLVDLARPWLGDAEVVEAQLKRWRYSQPVEPLDDALLATSVEGAPLLFAGDAFGGARVEGAYDSGRSAAEHLASILTGATR